MVCGYSLAMHIEEEYDIIICGAGLAGLSLLYRALKSGVWNDKKIIVVDQSDKSKNDRTWSFWKNEKTEFDHLIYKQWTELVFFSTDGNRIPLKSDSYTYNSIRSIDFYEHVLAFLRSFTNITLVKSKIESISQEAGVCILSTRTHVYSALHLFNSVYKAPKLRKGDQYFLQHFKGLRIKTPCLIPPLSEAWLMDFRTGQQHGTTFFYTLPVTKDEIFIEYTLFSKSILTEEQYNTGLVDYLNNVLKIREYEVLEEEFGVIPMTSYTFKRFEGNIVHIGTAGGDTRGSTGYTFTNTQKTISRIIESYRTDGHPFFKAETIGLKERLYDSTLLHVLADGKYKGNEVFSDLFGNTPASIIFKFLDAESNLFQDVKVMKSLRVLPFLKAFLITLEYKIFRR